MTKPKPLKVTTTRPRSRAHPRGQAPASYLLDGIPGELWDRARAKAAAEGLSMRHVILSLLVDYLCDVPRKKAGRG